MSQTEATVSSAPPSADPTLLALIPTDHCKEQEQVLCQMVREQTELPSKKQTHKKNAKEDNWFNRGYPLPDVTRSYFFPVKHYLDIKHGVGKSIS